WQASDICILVSEFEGTSISMLEAMALGCVPVVTRVSGTQNVIQFGINGFTVPVGDIVEMTRLIKLLEEDRSLLAKMGQNAHTTVLESYSYEQYVPWFLTLINEVWQQPPRYWPEGRPLHRYSTLKEQVIALSGEELSNLISSQKLIKALGFKIATHPNLKWLYRFRSLGKKIVGD
ncbi:MAG: glycosyltransferase family 4 protein, partial [Anaerolineae bacterium]|nr:glycosyltransferase family 4 protein [Anaerolineae bacterium]